MRLSDLRHSTSFRLGLLFAGFFGAALLLLFSFVYWWTRDYVVREVDSWLARETAGRAVLAAADVERTLNARAMVQPDDLHPIALFNSNGDWLAGTRVSLPQGTPPFDQPFLFTVRQGSEAAQFRGIVHRVLNHVQILLPRVEYKFPAPGLFSTANCWPSPLLISAEKARATIEELPPGANGTTRRMGLEG